MTTALIVLAKQPVAGFAKSRMKPALGEQGAARLAERLLAHTLQQVDWFPGVASAVYRELCVATPDGGQPARQDVLLGEARDNWRLTMQVAGDLGQRMLAVFERVLNDHDKVLLLGTDAPGLDAVCLQQADQALNAHDAVFVPTLDGGYALIGLRATLSRDALQALFVDMPWSTAVVMAEARQRAQQGGLRWVELPSMADLDEPGDLVHAPAWLKRECSL